MKYMKKNCNIWKSNGNIETNLENIRYIIGIIVSVSSASCTLEIIGHNIFMMKLTKGQYFNNTL